MNRKTAVVIDDEEDLSTYLSTILEENDFDVRTANEAVSGEALIREAPPDIVLLDLMMPGRSGVQLFAKLRRNEATRNIPVVMVTGIKEQMGVDWGEVVETLKVRKPDGFVEKPIDPDKLMSVVTGVLSGEARSGEVLHG
jgi:DNA-binding response OmpR family regulator